MPPKGVTPEHLKKYQFTKDTGRESGNYWSWLPGKGSAIWGDLAASIGRDTRGVKIGREVTTIKISPDIMNLPSIKTFKKTFSDDFNKHSHDALEEVGKYIYSEVVPRYFEQEGLRKGSWDQLAKTTVKSRGSAHPILRHKWSMYPLVTSERLIESITTKKTEPKLVLGPDKFPKKEAIKYFVHMTGGDYGRNGSYIPARPFIPRGEDDLLVRDKKRIKKIFQEHIYQVGK